MCDKVTLSVSMQEMLVSSTYVLNCNYFQTVACQDCKFKDEDCLHMQWILKVCILSYIYVSYVYTYL